jgi:hypothetical protein
MENEAEGRSKLLVILIATSIAVILWVLSLFYAYPEFQSTRLTESLAEIHSLVPLYYIAIGLVALSSLACVIWGVGGRGLHILLLTVFAIMLWVTPYLLTSFVRLPDSPWHVGSALNIPEIINGEPVPLSVYAWDFPGSFVYHYSFVNILDAEPLTYIYFFPLFCALLFVLLCYLLAVRVFNSKIAFLAMLLAIPGLHYLQLHASPHTVTALIMLTALLLLSTRGAARKAIPVTSILVIIIVVSHATTPLLFSIFLTAVLVMGIVYSRRIRRVQIALMGLLIICLAGWFSWFSYHPLSPTVQTAGEGIESKSAEGIYQSLRADFDVAGEFLTGTRFLYGSIYNLNKIIYFLYAAAAALGLVYVASRNYIGRTGFRDWLSKIGGIKRSEAILAITIIPLLILTFLLAGRSHVLIETGLSYIVLALSCIVASVVTRRNWSIKGVMKLPLILLVLFLTLSSPIVAFSIDAYSSFPGSEEEGLQFLSRYGSLEGKSVATTNSVQLAGYIQTSQNDISILDIKDIWALDPSENMADTVIFRNTGYYYTALRLDLSLEDNHFTQYRYKIENAGYGKIYSSPTFEVYSYNEAA